MKNVLRQAAIVSLFLAVSPVGTTVAEEFPYDLYVPTTVGELIESGDEDAVNSGIPVEKRRLWLPAVRHSSVVEYTGKSRELLESHREFLNNLHQSIPSISKEGVGLYTKEILVKEGDREVWMLIQGSVFPYLEKEVKVGWEINVYYYWFGALGHDYIFGINEFQNKSSIRLWVEAADYFYRQDFSDAQKLKNNMSEYYSRVYQGELLSEILDWIKGGSLNGSYYSSFYKDLQDIEAKDLRAIAGDEYRLDVTQKTCYELGHEPPIMGTIVSDYKISNYTQDQISEWYRSASKSTVAEFCLESHKVILLKLDSSSKKIVSEKWEITETKANLPGR